MSHQVSVIDGLRFDRIPFDELFAGSEPVLMRGLTADWPLVQAGRQAPAAVMDQLAANYNKKPVIVYVGDPEMRGRFGYNESVTGFNYRAERHDFVEVLDRIRAELGSEVHSYYYMNSIVVDQSFPGLAAQNSLVFDHPVFDRYPRVGKIWIGTESLARPTTTCRATSPAAYSGAGGSRCSGRSRSAICIRARLPLRRAARW